MLIAALEGIFYAAGPNFRRPNLEEVDNVDIAPTVTELLGIDPPMDAQGKKPVRGMLNNRGGGTHPGEQF